MLNHPAHEQAEWNNGKSMSCHGWTQFLEFWAYDSRIPGTKRIVVATTPIGAEYPHRCIINHSNFTQEQYDAGQSMTHGGWEQILEFWAFSERMPGTIRIAVGEAHGGNHRCMINHSHHPQAVWDDGKSMSCHGWTARADLEFWAYPQNPC